MLTDITSLSHESSLALAALAGAGFGVAGAAHCAGMCGAFPLSLAAAAKSRGERFARALLYNSGRGLTYVLLAGTAASLGMAVGKATGLADAGLWAARMLGVFAALAIAVSGLMLLGVRLPLVAGGHAGGSIAGFVARAGRGLMRQRGPGAAVSLGALNGLLPCPLVYTVLAIAFALGTQKALWPGLALGIGFALGTFPIMLSLGLIGGAVIARFKARLARVAGVALLLFAAITLVRAIDLDTLHTIMPMGDTPHIMGDGSIMAKPEGMSDGEYAARRAEEERDNARKAEAFAETGEAAIILKLRAADRDFERSPYHQRGMRCHTLTGRDIADIHADANAPRDWFYRCPCCGKRKPMRVEDLQPGTTLLLAANKPNPWISSDATLKLEAEAAQAASGTHTP